MYGGKERINESGKELDLRRPTLIKWRTAVCSTVGLMKAEPVLSGHKPSRAKHNVLNVGVAFSI